MPVLPLSYNSGSAMSSISGVDISILSICVDISIHILNITIFFDISLKIGKKVN